MTTSEFDALRTELTQAAAQATEHQHHIFHATGEITVEYSILGHLTDLLNAAVMVTHTIDRVRADDRLAEHLRYVQRQRQVPLTSDDTFLGSTS